MNREKSRHAVMHCTHLEAEPKANLVFRYLLSTYTASYCSATTEKKNPFIFLSIFNWKHFNLRDFVFEFNTLIFLNYEKAIRTDHFSEP